MILYNKTFVEIFEKGLKLYGLNKDIKKYIDKKIEKNKTFLENLTFYNEDYKLVSMFETDMNANLSPQRYFAEVANRVNTLFRYANELDLVPVFLTITLPSQYHRVSKDYNGFTPRQSALYLSEIWAKFLRLMIFRHMRDNTGHKMIYIRVYEPHKDGTPHLHAMIFIPRSFMKKVKKRFFDYLISKGFMRVGLKWIDNFKNARYESEQGAIAYILKYMNKTFKNAKENKMTNEAYYFAYHGIRRFITSQTLVPLWLYRKVKHNDDTRDLYQLTKQYHSGDIYSCFNKEYIMQRYINNYIVINEDDEILHADVEVNERIIYQKNHFISDQFTFDRKRYDRVPKKWVKQVEKIPVFVDDVQKAVLKDGSLYPYKTSIEHMKDLELYRYFESLDVDSEDIYYQHYLAVRNELVRRKLLSGEIYNLNNFDFKEFISNDET